MRDTVQQYREFYNSFSIWWRVKNFLWWRLSHLKCVIFGGLSQAELLLLAAWGQERSEIDEVLSKRGVCLDYSGRKVKEKRCEEVRRTNEF